MTVANMREAIIAKYGSVVRGKKVSDMSDSQIVAFYSRMVRGGKK